MSLLWTCLLLLLTVHCLCCSLLHLFDLRKLFVPLLLLAFMFLQSTISRNSFAISFFSACPVFYDCLLRHPPPSCSPHPPLLCFARDLRRGRRGSDQCWRVCDYERGMRKQFHITSQLVRKGTHQILLVVTARPRREKKAYPAVTRRPPHVPHSTAAGQSTVALVHAERILHQKTLRIRARILM